MSRTNIEAIYPLSPMQQGILFHTIYEPGSNDYIIQLSFRCSGKLEVAALRRAWAQVMTRHAMLRTSFVWKRQGEPVQVVQRGVELEMREEDWRGLEEREQEERLEEELGADRRRGFELQQAPLMRVQLARVGEQSYWVVWSFHHLLLDGWSVPRVLKEVFNYYEAYSQGRELELAESQPYVNYIRWLGRQDLAAAEEYWRERLKGFSEPTPLPFSQSNGNRAGEAGYRNELLELSETATQELRAYSRQQQVTINTVVQGAWALLLWRYSGEGDVVYGATVSGRPGELAGVEEMVGLFINTLPVRVEVRPEQEVGEWLRQLQTEQVEMRQYEYSPLVSVQGWSEVERGQGLFESIVVFENYPLETVFAEPAGAQVTADAAAAAAAEAVAISGMRSIEWNNFPLSLNIAIGQRLGLMASYDGRRFDGEVIERLLGHLQRLLESVLKDAGQALWQVQMLRESERQQLLFEWNQTEQEYPQELSLAELFEAQVTRAPAAVALVFGEQELTYGELNRRANQLGHYLRELGVRAEMAVGVCLERSVEMVVALLGVLKAGGVYVPLDADYPLTRLSLMMADAEVVVVVTQEEQAEQLPAGHAQLVSMDEQWAMIAQESETNPKSQSGLEHLAYITYTSGSTGRPKGVMVPQRAVRRLVQRPNYVELSAEERILQLAPLAFDASTFEIWGSLLNGGRLVMMGPEQPTLAEIGEVLERQGVTTLWLTAGLFHLMVEEQLERLGGLRQLLAGGEVLSVRDVERMRQRWPECVVINGYGPTENTTFTTCHRVGAGAELGRSVPIGRGVTNTQVYVVDGEQEVVAVGVVGELYTGGAGLARGYLSGAGETAARFVPDGFSGQRGGRLYRTGDLVRYGADGVLEYVGRRDEQVKVRGYRIELGEVEAVLREHSGVREAAVVVREEVAGDKRLVAYVVAEAAEATELEAGTLREYLRERLPEYMVPSAFVVLAELPLTPNGKVDRRGLPAPEQRRSEGAEYVGPRTAAEQTLARIWCEVLRLPQIGIHDNFFELGGDSILSIQVISRANRAGLQLTPRQLFEHQSIATLAAVAGTESQVQAEQGVVSGAVELTPVQHWFFEQEMSEPAHFNQALLLGVREALDPAVLAEAVKELVRHHDALRLRFERTAEGWQQVNAEVEEHQVFAVREVRGETAAELVAALHEGESEVQLSLDLGAGPLVRVAYFKVSAGEDNDPDGGQGGGRLLLAIHHLAVDGVSWRILLEDLRSAYEQLSRGEVVKLPPKTSSYQQWAQRLVAYAGSAGLQAELGYWTAGRGEQVRQLPIDLAGGENTRQSSGMVVVELDEEQTRALVQEVPAVYHTQINDLLLTALGLAYREWSGAEQLLIDLEGHGREDLFAEVDVSRTVGWFTAIFPVLLEVRGPENGANPQAAALKEIKEQLRAVPGRGIGYGLLRYLTPSAEVREQLRQMGRAEVSFNYLGQVDQVLGEEGLFAAAGESSGPSQSEQGERHYLLEINAIIAGGRLRVSWSYSRNLHLAESIERLASAYIKELEGLIGHCQSAGAGGYTPSDFGLARVSQEWLDKGQQQGWEIADIYGLSPLQQGLLFHTIYAPELGEYVVQLSYQVKGELQVGALRRAWQEVMERHAVLRSSFHWEEQGEPVQVVHRHVRLVLEQQDWRGISEREQEERLEEELGADRRRGFELQQAPLMRVQLARVGEQSYWVVWSFHHLLLDGWSVPRVLKEVFNYYEAYSQGRELELAESQPYVNYIRWLGRQDLAAAEEYWRERLKGFSEPTPLPFSQSNGNRAGEAGYRNERFELSERVTQQLRAYSRQQQVTINTVVQGAWALLLWRYSGEGDVVYGATVSGRPAELAGVEEMVGLFINTLPVRVEVRPEQEVGEWLRQLQTEQVEMRQYEYSPLVAVQGWSEVERGQGLFESIVVFENYPLETVFAEPAGAQVTAAAAAAAAEAVAISGVRSVEWTNYPLTIIAMPGQRLSLTISYDRSRFEAEQVRRMLEHYERLLAEMIGNAEQRVTQVQMLSEAERQQVLYGWNQTQQTYPRDLCLHELFEAQVARTPEAVAVVFGAQELTYGELNARANQLGHYLRQRGVGLETLVGICLERSVEMVVALLGVLKAGGAYLPLEPKYPQQRLAFMWADAELGWLLTQQHLGSLLPAPEAHVVLMDEDWNRIAQESTGVIVSQVTPANAAYTIYTSGSTGTPKAAVIPHRSICNHMLWMAASFPLDESDRVLQKTAISFDASVWEFYAPLLSGAVLVMLSGRESDVDQIKAEVVRRRVTTLQGVPTLLRMMMDGEMQWAASLRRVFSGGEMLSGSLARTLRERIGCELYNLYGPTEAAVDVSARRCAADEGEVVPIGRPIANVQLYVLDEEMEALAVGVRGEIYIGGVAVGRGYLNRAEQTGERFVPDPFSSEAGARLYRTGDVGRYRRDGELEYVGRRDEQVKVRGYRIELGEVEAALRAQSVVREAVVVVREDVPGDKRLVAYVVVNEAAEATELGIATLREYLKERLPEYMVPGAIVMLEELPLTTNGKVNRRGLPAPEYTRSESAEYVGPRTVTEQTLADIWSEVLRLPQISIHDNFFELGGHSLLATQIISRVRQTFEIEMPLRALFEEPTIERLAQRIEAAIRAGEELEAPPLRRVSREQELPLSYAQQRLWFLDQLAPGSTVYNIPIALHLSGALEVAALEQSVSEVVRRHEVLRTSFESREGRPVQVIAAAEALSFPVTDLSELAAAEQERAVREMVAAAAQEPFDLGRGPLLRVEILRLNEAEHVLLVTMHHIVSDGWSMGVLTGEVAALYEAYTAGASSPLAELEIQYADYAVWQREWLQGEVLERELEYWREQLADAPTVLELPVDRPRPAVQSYGGRTEAVVLNASLTAGLQELSQREGVTMFMSLLAAFEVLLWRYTGQSEMVVGTSIANRTRKETEGLIGFFVDLLPLRGSLGEEISWRELLQRAREVCLGAYGHQEVPFEKLVEELQPAREMSHHPLFQVLMELQNAPQEAVGLKGLKLRGLDVGGVTAKFELRLSLMQNGGEVGGILESNAELFEAETIRRMVRHYQRLVESLVAEPERRLGAVQMLSEEEREQLVSGWNQTVMECGREQGLAEMFEAQVRRSPEAVALVYGEQKLTYEELNGRANQLAHHLGEYGVGVETVVGVLIERSVELVVGLLGVLKAGAAYLPLESGLPLGRLAYMLEETQAPVVLTQESLLDRVPAHWGHTLCVDSEWGEVSQESGANLELATSPERLAYVIYTSGSTGRPKGVMIPQRGVVNYLSWCRSSYEVSAGAGSPLHTSISFDLTVTSLFGPLVSGVAVELLGAEPGPEVLSSGIKGTEDYSLVKLTPGHLELLNRGPAGERIAGWSRVLVIGGEALSGESLRYWQEHAPETRLINEYGPTETVVGCSMYEVQKGEEVQGSVPIGRPIGNVQMYVVDESGEVVAAGVKGEIVIGGAGVGRGYLGRAWETAERFRPDGFSGQSGARVYHSGDVGRHRGDGELEYVGRRDEQVKVRGYRIELGEVEAVLREHSGVREAVVVMREEVAGEKRLVAYVVAVAERAGAGEGGKATELEAGTLREYLRERLPEYMVPGAFVVLAELPLTPNGKVDRRGLPAPEQRRSESAEYVGPRTAAEQTLARIWSEVLRLPQIGIYDNFFELGGDSILSIQVISRANRAGLQLTPRQLFEHQSIATLAAVAGTESQVQAEQGVVSGAVELTPVQHWFFEQEMSEPEHFNQALLLGVREALDPAVLEQAVKQLLRHHDALRLRFERTAEGWQQVNAEVEEHQVFAVREVRGETAAELVAALHEGESEVQLSLDLGAGPLVRVAYFKVSAGEDNDPDGGQGGGRLLLAIHHLAVDGVSWRILLEDLRSAYEQLSRGEVVKLPPKTSSYQQWAQRLVAYAGSAGLQAELGYWTAGRGEQVRQLPIDLAGGENTRQSSGMVVVELAEEQTRALVQEVPAVYHTQINDLLLTALGLAYREWSGAEQLLIDLEGHGREDLFAEVDVSRTVGWFTAIFPVLLEVRGPENGANPQAAALKAVKEQLRAVPRRGIGYGLLRYLSRDVSVGERLRAQPQSEVAFNYLGQSDQALGGNTSFDMAGESSGGIQSEKGQRHYLLEINAIIAGGRLRVSWSYSRNLHRPESIERLAGAYLEQLQELIRHCQSRGAGGYTPSDFGLARVSQEWLDAGQQQGWEIEDIYGLSPLQQGLLFHTIYAPQGGEYVVQSSYRIEGDFQAPALERAWQQAVDRHDVLRSSFHWEELAEPVQVVHRHVRLVLEQQDWRGISETEQQERLEEELGADRRRGFELQQAPLMRVWLAQLGEQSYCFMWSFHHVLLDGWSLPLLIKDVMSCYEAECQGEPLKVERGRGYRQYIRWLRQQDLRAAETYWRHRLAGFTEPTSLPFTNSYDGPRARKVYRNETLTLSEATTRQLREYGRQQQVTINTVVQGAWALLLWRYSGERDLVYGTTVSGRPPELAGVEEMVGLFINTLPVRVRVRAEQEVGEWLRQLQAEQVEMRQYEYSPLVAVQGWSDVERGQGLFESLVVFENYPIDIAFESYRNGTKGEQNKQNSKLEVNLINSIEQTNYPITVTAAADQKLSATIHYDSGRFEEEQMKRFRQHYERLLESLITDARQPVRQIQMLSEAERQQILVQWNDTRRDYPQGICAQELFEAQVERTPEGIAVCDEGVELSYRELNNRANQLAHHLIECGLGPESIAGLLLPRSAELLIALLGVVKAGGAYLPLDPSYPAQRLSFILDDAAAAVLLTHEGLLAGLSAAQQATALCLDTAWPLISQQSRENPRTNVRAANLAYLIYTSGSTGQPHGILVTHGSLVNLICWHQEAFGVQAVDRATQLASIGFDAAVWEVWPYLSAGARLHLVPDEVRMSPEQLRDWLVAEGITVSFVPTPMAERLLRMAWPETSRLRVLQTAGDQLHERPETGLSMQVVNNYGPTEATVATTSGEVRAEGAEGERGWPTIGRAIANVAVYVVDAEMEAVAVGVVGELLIGGRNLARGYAGRAELTAERFVPDAFSEEGGRRLYRTGDLVRYRPDGELEFVGRRDEQVKVRGYRIELGEVEAVLRAHRSVREAVVVARAEELGEKRLVAYVVAESESEKGMEGGGERVSRELRSYLRERLPEYMVPGAFVWLEEIPLTPHGKIDRRGLPAPERRSSESAGQVLPRTAVEELLAQIWRTVLGEEQISIHDNFFELGGHSLLATQVISRVRQTFEIEMPLRALFEGPTIGRLAQRIEAAIRAGEELEAPPLRRVSREQELPLSFAQQRLWFLDQLEPGSTVYNIPVALHLSGPLAVAALEQSVSEVVRRHEVLRTSFVSREGRPVQVIAAAQALSFPVRDLSALAAAEQERAVRELVAAAAQEPFDLGRGPLLRVEILRLNEAEHVLLVTMHHIVSDGWSMGVLTGEVAALYEAYTAGASSPLPELEIQYADYAVWQREWLQGEVLERELEYWREQLAGAPTVLELPVDRPRPAVQSYRGMTEPVVMNESLTAGLQGLSQREGVTMFMSLLAAFQVLLWRYSGQSDVVVGTPIANRTRAETEGLIGFFVNMLALRTRLSGELSWEQVLERVREVCLGAYGHQEVPFEKLVDELQPQRNLSHQPVFQVMLTLQNAPQPAAELRGAWLRGVATEARTAKFELTLMLEMTGKQLLGGIEYNTDLFEGETIRRLGGHYQRLLELLVTNSRQPLRHVSLLSESEREEIVYQWNETETWYGPEVCLHELFEAQVARTPEAVAVVFGAQELTYGELNARANQLGHYLRQRGVGPETLVGICLERSVEMVLALLGVLKAGGAYLPLEPHYPSERLAFILDDAQVHLLLTQHHLADQFQVQAVEMIYVDADWHSIAAHAPQPPPRNLARPGNLAYVIYTSGSTGKPKGVLVTHANVARLFSATHDWFNFNDSDVWTLFHSYAFDFSVWEIWGALLYGGRLVIVPHLVSRSPGAFYQLLIEEKVTVLNQTPSAFRQLMQAEESWRGEGELSLRLVIFGGETLEMSSLRPWFERHGDEHPELVNMYGITETTVHVTYRPIMVADTEAGGFSRIGRAIGDLEVHLLDRELEPVPLGVYGELHVGGAGVARNYLNRAELTAERFVPHPYGSVPGARLYRSGDLARYRNDGELEYVGRRDQQVKVRGHRIELGEVEAVLREHSEVREAVVVVREDVPGDQRLVAYVVEATETEAAQVGELRNYLKERLPDYMVPSAFVRIAELPLTANGKVDRRALPEPDRTGSETPYVAPRTPVEEELAAIWANVLGMEKISIYDNFFALGGHSLLSTQLIARVRKTFEVDIPLLSLFEMPTIAELALVIEEMIIEELEQLDDD